MPTPVFENYVSGSEYHVSDFDIANVVLEYPLEDLRINEPMTFKWKPRTSSPSDSYGFSIYYPFYPPQRFLTDPPLGYVAQYIFTSNATGNSLAVGDYHFWEIWAFSPDGGYGVSFESRWIWYAPSRGYQPLSDAPIKTMPDLDDWTERQLPLPTPAAPR